MYIIKVVSFQNTCEMTI